MLLSLAALLVPIAFAAQDGHGGSTEVIARVNAPTEQTGFWIIASVICMTTAWLLIVRARSKPSK